MIIIIFYTLVCIFLPLILNSWLLTQFRFIILLLLTVMSFPVNDYFSYISYLLGVDYFSYGLILLRILIVSLIVISRNSIKSTFYDYLFLLICIILCFILIMIFSSLNILIIYLFFEFRLIPLIILIFGWGYQPERLISGLYLFFYTLFASLPLFLLLIYIYITHNSLFFDINFNLYYGFIVHFCLMFAFLVKLPIFIVHFWLPKAHVQAPVSGSMILAGLLLKIGGYGLLRVIFLSESIFLSYRYFWYSLRVVGGILVRLVCFLQGDLKCLIAYSSVAHISLCLIGILRMQKWGIIGSYLIIISHGLCSSALFCLANISYERFSRRRFFINKGILTFIPRLCMLWFLFRRFNIGCPPRLNFFREVFILNRIIAFWGSSFIYFLFISFFSACFRIYLFSYSQHGNSCILYSYSLGRSREYLALVTHLIPLILLILSLNSYLI